MMELREKIARAICGNWVVGDDRPWQQWAEEADAVIEVLAKQEPVAFGLYSGWALKATYLKEHEACDQRDRRQLTADLGGSLEAYRVAPLYALPGAQAAVPDGWLRAIDEEMVGAHIGIANAKDDYATAKEKLNKLICWHVAAATDPAVNGGWQLVPIEPTPEMMMIDSSCKHHAHDDKSCVHRRNRLWIWSAMLKAAPKPEGK